MTIDYVDISYYGLLYLKSTGLDNMPKIKRPIVNNWSDSHGIDIDLTTAFKEARNITSEFILVGTSISDYQSKLASLQLALQAIGLRVIKYDNYLKPRFLFLSEEIAPELIGKLNNSQVACKLTLNMTEPNPVGRYFHTNDPVVNVSFTISCSTPIIIDWGDGISEIKLGTSQSCSHNFTTFHYIALFGNITDISALTSIVGLTEIT